MTLAHATVEELRVLLATGEDTPMFGDPPEPETDAYVYLGGKRYSGADVAVILAALPALLDRLESKAALPVIKTCGGCGWSRPEPAEQWRCGRDSSLVLDIYAAPPATCPLRAALNDEAPR